MSNKQQTAVDLFHDKVNELIVGKKTITSNDLGKIWLECKEMEREQIAEAFTKGNRLDVYDGTETSGEKYYNGLYECQFEMDTSTSSAKQTAVEWLSLLLSIIFFLIFAYDMENDRDFWTWIWLFNAMVNYTTYLKFNWNK
jgi:hypothetical protein